MTVSLLAILPIGLWGQSNPPCPVPPPPGAASCIEACIYCQLDGVTGSTNGIKLGDNTVCDQITIHNAQWFGFAEGSEPITIDVLVSNCQNGDGLQVALFNQCSDPDALTCNPGATGMGDQPISLQYDNYLVGKSYYLLIDGWNGDLCDFTIKVTAGTVLPQPPGTPDSVSGPSQVCSNQEYVYSVNNVPNTGYYIWSVPTGASINGHGNILAVDAPNGSTVTVTMGTVGGNICVQAGNSCHSPSSPVCIPASIIAPPSIVLPPLTICNEDLPFIWDYPPFIQLGSPGTYTLNGSLHSWRRKDK